MDECAFEHFDVGYESLIVRCNTEMVSVCKFNRENFNLDGTVKYFYVDFIDGFNDRIAEKELLKIVVRLSQKEAMIRYKHDLEAIKQKKLQEESFDYIQKHQSEYRKSKRGNNITPVEFMEEEKRKLQNRLVKTLNCKLQSIQSK